MFSGSFFNSLTVQSGDLGEYVGEREGGRDMLLKLKKRFAR